MTYGFEDKNTVGFTPSEGETLIGYSTRLSEQIAQIRGYALNHVTWFTHKGPGACWICDLLQMADYIAGIQIDIAKEDTKNIWKAVRKGDDPLTFVFTKRKK